MTNRRESKVMEENMGLAGSAAPCLFCDDGRDEVVYRERLTTESFSGYSFSARRQRKREHYQIVKCVECGLVRSDPIIDLSRMNDLYRDSEFLSNEEAIYAARNGLRLIDELKSGYKIPTDEASLVEIGCGNGLFLHEARKAGIKKVLGFEPSSDCLAQAPADIANRIINQPFEPGLVDGEKFNLGCLFQVIDHLPRPDETLRRLGETLSPGAGLVITCHDVQGWTARILGEASPIFDVEHTFFFSKETLARLLEKAGYRVLEVGSLFDTYRIDYWLRMAPVPAWLRKLTPAALGSKTLGLKAGNIYAFGLKE